MAGPAVLTTREGRLYDTDPHAWAKHQVAAMRRQDWAGVDWENVVEEIDDVARRERGRWTNHCASAIDHLLAIEYREQARPEDLKTWRYEVEKERNHMADAVEDSPSLRSYFDEMFAKAWRRGRRRVLWRLTEYDSEGLGERMRTATRKRWDRTLPKECPYSLERVAGLAKRGAARPSVDVWPAGVAEKLNAELGARYPVAVRELGSSGWSR